MNIEQKITQGTRAKRAWSGYLEEVLTGQANAIRDEFYRLSLRRLELSSEDYLTGCQQLSFEAIALENLALKVRSDIFDGEQAEIQLAQEQNNG